MTEVVRFFESGRIRGGLRRACILVLFVMDMAACALSATITDLSLGGVSYATGINASGQVVGYSTTGTGSAYDAFLYSNGAMTNIGSLINGTNSMAEGINNSGQVVGSYSPGLFNSQAFLYSGGAVSPVGTLSAADSINDSGQIVGNAPLSFMNNSLISENGYITTNLAALYSGGSVTALGELGTICGGTYPYFSNPYACSSNAAAINDSGQIVGASGAGAGDTAVVYSNGAIDQLYPSAVSGGGGGCGSYDDAPVSTPSAANAINNSGVVVGYYDIYVPYDSCGGPQYTGYSGYTAFEFSPATDSSIFLGEGAAYGINDLEQVVGSSSVLGTPCTSGLTSGCPTALLWANGVETDLNSLLPANSGWVLTSAVGINDAGQIVGNGLFDGQEQAFMLDTQTSSAPEPGTLVLLSAGAALLLMIRFAR